MGSFFDIFVKFVMFILGRVFIDFKVLYNVFDWLVNFCNFGLLLFDMFGLLIKVLIYVFVIMCGCLKCCCSIFRVFDSLLGIFLNFVIVFLVWLLRNCNRCDIFWVFEMFWVLIILLKCVLNWKYLYGLLENLIMFKGGRLDLVIIEFILVVSFVIIVLVVLVREDILLVWWFWLDGNVVFINGGVVGFKLDFLIWNFGVVVLFGVELNNGFFLVVGILVIGVYNIDFLFFSVGLWFIIFSIFVGFLNFLEFRYLVLMFLGLFLYVMFCMLFVLLIGFVKLFLSFL